MPHLIQPLTNPGSQTQPSKTALILLGPVKRTEHFTEKHWTFVQQNWVLFSDVKLMGGQTYWTFCWTRINFLINDHPLRKRQLNKRSVTNQTHWTTLNISKNKRNVESFSFRSVKSLIAIKLHWARLNKGEQGLTMWSNALNILHSTNVHCCSVKCSVRLTGPHMRNIKETLKCWTDLQCDQLS